MSDKPSVKALSNQELEALYDSLTRYKNIEMPSMIADQYNTIVQSFDLADIEAELVARGYELPMSN